MQGSCHKIGLAAWRFAVIIFLLLHVSEKNDVADCGFPYPID